MEDGTYRKINFGLFNIDKFTPHLFSHVSNYGCGATALSLLIGKHPDEFPTKDHWTTRYMLECLRKHGFKTAKLTKRSITNVVYPAYPVSRSHVLLLNVKYIKNLGSWLVIYDERIYHNFEIIKFQGYELLNHPIVEAFLIVHPSWKAAKDGDNLNLRTTAYSAVRARQAMGRTLRTVNYDALANPKIKKIIETIEIDYDDIST
jgi:hypothetical protein